jgi:hypothetical protein
MPPISQSFCSLQLLSESIPKNATNEFSKSQDFFYISLFVQSNLFSHSTNLSPSEIF